MHKIQFYPFDFSYKIIDGRTVMYIYGRTEDGKKICVKDKNFLPYLIVEPEEHKDIDSLKIEILSKRELGIIKAEIIKKKKAIDEHEFIKWI